MPPHDNSRNTILFVVIAAIMLLAYSYFVMQPQAEQRRAAERAAAGSTLAPVPAPSSRAAVFEPFVRTTAARRAGVAGTGLGLAVAARIAAALGGTLHCDSTPGQGSEFSLTLPREP